MQLWYSLLSGTCNDCHMGGIPTIHHNEIRDITATLLTEISHNVAIEPLLQPLTNESFTHSSANTDPNACLDIRARSFRSTGQDAFFGWFSIAKLHHHDIMTIVELFFILTIVITLCHDKVLLSHFNTDKKGREKSHFLALALTLSLTNTTP